MYMNEGKEFEKEKGLVIIGMERDGGSFIVSLAQALRHADPFNARKIKNAFNNEWNQYKKIGEGMCYKGGRVLSKRQDEIIEVLMRYDKISTSQVANFSRTSFSTALKNLKILEENNLVERIQQKNGNFWIYIR